MSRALARLFVATLVSGEVALCLILKIETTSSQPLITLEAPDCMHTMDVSTVRALPDKHRYYTQQAGLNWSESRGLWLCFDPALIDSIFMDPRFIVHDYSPAKVASKFNLDLDHTSRILQFVPLAHEGDLHQSLRRQYIQTINANSREALKHFKAAIGRTIDLRQTGETVDLVPPLHRAATEAMFSLLDIGIEVPSSLDMTTLSLLFDDTASLKKRREINAAHARLIDSLPPHLDEEERLLKVAMLTVGIRPLLGALTESLLRTLMRTPAGVFSELHWDANLPCSGIILVERVASVDVMIAEQIVRKGQRIKLFIEAAGFGPEAGPEFSRTYFAAPSRHVCPGMRFSMDMWTVLTKHLAGIPAGYRLLGFDYAERDGVFNFPTSVVVML